MSRSFNLFLMCAIVLGFSGCASTRPQPTQLRSTFNESEASAMVENGTSTVSGSALIRQNGGGVVTCAGNIIDLVPATDYASERMRAVYGSDSNGYLPSEAAKDFNFQPSPIEYFGYRKRTTCDSQGNFEFENVVGGEFYLETKVIWRVGSVAQGGWLMKKISVPENARIKTVLSP